MKILADIKIGCYNLICLKPMKKNLHPKLNNVVFVDITTGEEYVTKSTASSEQTKKIDGVDHYVIQVQVSSSSHPFYTGKHRIVDTENLVKKFEKKTKKAQTLSEKLAKSKKKRNERKQKTTSIKEEQSLTLKDMLKQMQ